MKNSQSEMIPTEITNRLIKCSFRNNIMDCLQSSQIDLVYRPFQYCVIDIQLIVPRAYKYLSSNLYSNYYSNQFIYSPLPNIFHMNA